MNKSSLIILIFLYSVSNVFGQDELKKYDELEGIFYIRELIKDKKFDLIIKEFSDIKISDSEKSEFYFLVGYSFFQKANYLDAIKILRNFENISKTQTDFYIILAKSLEATKDFKACSDSLDKINLVKLKNDDWITYTNCKKKSGPENNKKLIENYLKIDLQDEEFYLQSQDVLLANGLFQFSNEKRMFFFDKCRKERSYLLLQGLLEKYKIEDLRVLEFSHLCYPESTETTHLLVKKLFEKEKYHSVAYIFEELSFKNDEYTQHAFEFYKTAGRKSTSDYFAFLSQDKTYTLSKLSEYLDNSRLVELLTFPVEKELYKNNSDLSYALGFSSFKLGHNDNALTYLKSGKKLTEKDKNLINIIDKCKNLSWRCRP